MTSPSHKDVFFRMTRVADELASHVRDAFGPMGKQAVVVNDVGEVSFTRNGIRILKSLNCTDPLARMMIRAVETHVERYGDGGKTFILLFAGLLSSISDEIEWDSRQVSNRLTEARHAVIALRYFIRRDEDVVRLLFSERAAPIDKGAVTRLFGTTVRSATGATGKVADKLAEVLTQFLLRSRSDASVISDDVEYAIKNFSYVCVKEAGRSIENTRLSSAVLLSRPPLSSSVARVCDNRGASKSVGDLANKFSLDSAPPSTTSTSPYPHLRPSNRLLLFACPLTSRRDVDRLCGPQEWHFQTENLAAVLTWRSGRLSALVRRLKDLRVTVVVCKCAILPFEAAALAASGIRCVEHLPEEEMAWLVETFHREAVNDVTELFAEDATGFFLEFAGLEVVSVNGEDRISLSFAEPSDEQSRRGVERLLSSAQPAQGETDVCTGLKYQAFRDGRQLFVCSPTLATCDALSFQLENCLRLSRTLTRKTLGAGAPFPFQNSSPLIVCGGFFEIFLNLIIRSFAPAPVSPLDGSRLDFRRKLEASRLSMRRRPYDGTNPDAERTSLAIDDLPLASELNRGIGYLEKALLEIPSLIHRNSAATRKGRERLVNVLNDVERALLSSLSPSSSSPPSSQVKIVGIDAKTGSPFWVKVAEKPTPGARAPSDGDNGYRTNLRQHVKGETCETTEERETGGEAKSAAIPCIIENEVEIDSCGLESYEGKVAVVKGVLDLVVVALNIESVVHVGDRLGKTAEEC